MKIIVKKINAFTKFSSGGNPAGVVLNTPLLTEEQMKTITKTLDVSETAFVFPSEKADFKTRFFSPKVEVELCGHGTIATFYNLAEEGIIPPTREKVTITQETKAGILPVDVFFKNKKCEKVMMTQGKPILRDIILDFNMIASSLNTEREEIDKSLPQQIVSTGLFTLPIGINSLRTLKSIKPDFEEIKKICMKYGVGSFHLFTFETIETHSTYHARNFAPLYGVNEDPATGTANGAVSSYLIKNGVVKDKKLICEQGDIIGRPGRVFVEIDNDDVVKVGGKATVVEKREIEV